MGQDSIITGSDAENVRLDRWLRRNFPGLTQGIIEKSLRTGVMKVDGCRVTSGLRLKAGQTVTLPPLPSKPAPPPTPAATVDPALVARLHEAILYQDDHILVLNKPAGLAVQGGSGMRHHHLDAALDGLKFGADSRPRLVHRLDKDTSGVLVLGRTPAAAAALAAAFKGRDLRKCYWALVVGIPDVAQGRIRLALSKQEGRGGEKVVVDEKNGKSAVTWFRIVDRIHRKAAWLEMEPRTGRTHQLRVHCSEALQTPILGDGKYGGTAAFLEGSGLSRKLHLHARALSLPHPQTGRMMTFTAPLSPHMQASFDFFGLNERDAGTPFTAFELPHEE